MDSTLYKNRNSIIVFQKALPKGVEQYCTIYDDSVNYPLIKYKVYRIINHPKKGIGYVLPKFLPSWIIARNYSNYSHRENESLSTIPKQVNIVAKTKPRNIIQQNGLDYLNGVGKFTSLKTSNARFIALQTGLGKTFLTFNFLSQIKKIGLVLVHQTSFVEQWVQEEMIKHTDIELDDVGVITGLDSIKKMNKAMEEGKEYKFFMGIYRTFSMILKPFHVQTLEDLDKVTDLEKKNLEILRKFIKLSGISVRFNDEAHLEMKSNFLIDSFFNFEMTVDLTATPRESEVSKNLTKMQNLISSTDNLFGKEKYNRREAFVKSMFITFKSEPETEWAVKVNASRGVSIPNYGNYIYEQNLDFVVDEVKTTMEMFYKKDKNFKVAIVLPNLLLVTAFYEGFSSLFPDKSIGNFTSQIKKIKDREQEKYKDIVITTNKSFAEGKNSPVNILFNLVPLGEGTSIEQVIGRLRFQEDKPSIYVELVDVSFEKIRTQLNRKKKSLLEEQVVKTAVIVKKW